MITCNLMGCRDEGASGAVDVRDFGQTQSYYPWIPDTPDEPDKIPPLPLVREQLQDYAHLYRAAELEAVDDAAWWLDEGFPSVGKEVVKAGDAADCLRRMPVFSLPRRASPLERLEHDHPTPARGIIELLGVITAIEQALADLKTDVEEERTRRWERLTRRRGPG